MVACELLCTYQAAYISRIDLGRCGLLCHHAVVELHVVVGHAVGVEALASTLEGAVSEVATQLRVVVENSDGICKAFRIIGSEI